MLPGVEAGQSWTSVREQGQQVVRCQAVAEVDSRLRRRASIDCRLGPPRIPYRETVRGRVSHVEGKQKKQKRRYKGQWREPIEWADGLRNTSVGVPSGKAFGLSAGNFFCGAVIGGATALNWSLIHPMKGKREWNSRKRKPDSSTNCSYVRGVSRRRFWKCPWPGC